MAGLSKFSTSRTVPQLVVAKAVLLNDWKHTTIWPTYRSNDDIYKMRWIKHAEMYKEKFYNDGI